MSNQDISHDFYAVCDVKFPFYGYQPITTTGFTELPLHRLPLKAGWTLVLLERTDTGDYYRKDNRDLVIPRHYVSQLQVQNMIVLVPR